MSDWRYLENKSVDVEWSELAIKILHSLSEGEKYSVQLSEELSCKQQTASNYLSDLSSLGLVERSKRTQAQYYKITEKGKRFLENFLSLNDKITFQYILEGDFE